ncbi:MAG TPA: hypothetical protein VN655_03460 [Pseudolabrys sp.]|nr:hypothetical protein [Pseudolabrys sp.]
MRVAALLAFGLLVTSSSTVFAYTQEEVNACTPDAMRLCQAAIPDAHRVGDCLYHARRQLSPACAAVFARYIGHGAQQRRAVAAETN